MDQNRARLPVGSGSRSPSFSLVGDVVSELRKVTWPTRQETTRLTILVLALSGVAGLVLGFIDIGFSRLFGLINV